ncbi:hypothetical protein Vretimale_17315 [Volvox reticuliferus]|uniref:Secondary thiamine-phosphate synthase enzyme n=2 Tax=Volvox reticuliferus TaxID=1737510 RepID=A0A8J4GST1_9CHLO|nr:hypothetical protein Vretimale_17315 [Volvox reticuliferus]
MRSVLLSGIVRLLASFLAVTVNCGAQVERNQECPEYSSGRMKFSQHEIRMPAMKRGCHLVTDKVLKEIGASLAAYEVGLANIFIQHTSASLTINENADPDVRKDMETYLNLSVPEGPKAPWVHTDEGPDDMPAHVKSSMFGASLTVPISHGRLALGTWQGIWLCEHRDRASGRNIIVTLQGE